MTITRRAVILCIGCSALGRFGVTSALADGPPAGRRIALSGYDPVAYFTDGKPAKGSPEFWYAFDDVVYLFRSAQHREQFGANRHGDLGGGGRRRRADVGGEVAEGGIGFVPDRRNDRYADIGHGAGDPLAVEHPEILA